MHEERAALRWSAARSVLVDRVSVRRQHVERLLVHREANRQVGTRPDRDRPGRRRARTCEEARDHADAPPVRELARDGERLGATGEDGADAARPEARRGHENVRLGERLVPELDGARLVAGLVDLRYRAVLVARGEWAERGERERATGACEVSGGHGDGITGSTTPRVAGASGVRRGSLTMVTSHRRYQYPLNGPEIGDRCVAM